MYIMPSASKEKLFCIFHMLTLLVRSEAIRVNIYLCIFLMCNYLKYLYSLGSCPNYSLSHVRGFRRCTSRPFSGFYYVSEMMYCNY